ncbi:MAG TPA: outer membrane lipoprotein carrier protein LolA [Longimicrobiales bacterium]
MMRRVLIGVALAGTAVAIALGMRGQLLRRAPEAEPVAREAPVVEPVPVGEAPGAAEPEDRPSRQEEVASSGAETGRRAEAGRAVAGPVPAPASAPVSAAGSSGQEEASQEPEAAAILRRASAAYAKIRSLQADFVQELENPLLGTRSTGRGTLYQRRPDRILLRFTEPAGDVIVGDGRHFWIYYPSVDAKQVIRAPAGEAGAGGVDLQAQFVGDPVTRFTATLEGKESVGGRPAHVLTLVPRQRMGYRKLKVWVDERDHLVRRFEITEENGAVRRFELRNLVLNPSLGDELFRFTPPPGARIIDRG